MTFPKNQFSRRRSENILLNVPCPRYRWTKIPRRASVSRTTIEYRISKSQLRFEKQRSFWKNKKAREEWFSRARPRNARAFVDRFGTPGNSDAFLFSLFSDSINRRTRRNVTRGRKRDGIKGKREKEEGKKKTLWRLPAHSTDCNTK